MIFYFTIYITVFLGQLVFARVLAAVLGAVFLCQFRYNISCCMRRSDRRSQQRRSLAMNINVTDDWDN